MTIHYSDLDTASVPELEDAYREWTARPRFYGRIFFPERPKGYVTATRVLGYFAGYNAAVKCRLAGDIGKAVHWEHKCEDIYNELPDFARW